MDKITISKDLHDKLDQESQSYCQIKSFMKHFCDEDETVVMGVLRLLAEYHDMKSDSFWQYWEKHQMNSKSI